MQTSPETTIAPVATTEPLEEDKEEVVQQKIDEGKSLTTEESKDYYYKVMVV